MKRFSDSKKMEKILYWFSLEDLTEIDLTII
ncbi:hypothetical protein HRED_02416 [Candidatus Haloredivivus sp. G17]|nr:hypothetical protein HRED_02416 [Candidatus Haloredivivus sp. G17]